MTRKQEQKLHAREYAYYITGLQVCLFFFVLFVCGMIVDVVAGCFSSVGS